MATPQGLNVCISSQTPLVQFLAPENGRGGSRRAEEPVDLGALRPDIDYRFSPGGVTRMVYPFLRHGMEDGLVRSAHWVALNPNAPRTARLGEIYLHHTSLGRERLAGYGKTKESLWGAVHGTGDADSQDGLFWTEDFAEYTYYNRATAERMRALDGRHDFDLFYVHDFQQLPTGEMLHTSKFKIFRWHIPFDERTLPVDWKPTLKRLLNGYDVVVASSRRYLAAIRTLGYRGRTRLLYPYLDPQEYGTPPKTEVDAVCARWGLDEKDVVVLVVGRMDPMKGQDQAIRAFSRIARKHPHLKLVLAGNGSFSGARGGLALSKSDAWRRTLERLAKRSGVASRIVMTGYVDQHGLDCLYERCRFTLLPSRIEGFGLVAIEGWLHRKPTLVSATAGVAELVSDEQQGLLVDPSDPHDLAEKMETMLSLGDERVGELGRLGYFWSRQCWIDSALVKESRLLAEAVEA